MNATALKTALIRANVSQVELAKRLGRSRSMVSDWIRDDAVPAEWVPIVYETLGLPMPAAESVTSVEAAIAADQRLSDDHKDNLLALLRAMRQRR